MRRNVEVSEVKNFKRHKCAVSKMLFNVIAGKSAITERKPIPSLRADAVSVAIHQKCQMINRVYI
jgi:hypothetical protein